MKVINILINKKRLLQKKKKKAYFDSSVKIVSLSSVLVLWKWLRVEMIKYGNVKVFIEVNLYLTQYHFICKNISSHLPRSLIF